MTMNKALTIAGSDSSGGAGIQADLKTFQELGVYGMTALTTIVTMDPDNSWSHNVFPQEVSTVEQQLKTIVKGVGVQALKTGMLGSVEIIELAAKTIEEYGLKNVVVDPVMVCKGEDEALHPETTVSLRDVLVPKATVVTPNLFEASQLSGLGPIKTFEILESERIETTFTHGAGCTYSAAIAAELAKGSDVKQAIYTAKEFITEAIRHSFALNQYVGPTNHGAYRRNKEKVTN